jgi:hypothetical protein
VLSWVADNALGVCRPGEKAAQGGQSGVDRGRLLTLAELGLVLAQVAGGRLQERGLVVLIEPGGEPLQVGDVLAGGAFADLRVLGQKRQEGG